MADNKRLNIIPLGGLGEIGLNSMLLGCGDALVMVDCGLMFPEDYHLGVDVVIPRFDFLAERSRSLRGIVLTHGHEDHIGALPWLIPQLSRTGKKPCIYSLPFTLALVEHRLRERNLLDEVHLQPVSPERPLVLGPFSFNFFPVSHSIVDSLALGVETPVGRLVHTGDFKLDADPLHGWGTDLERFRAFAGPGGARLLLSDSTNVENEGRSLGERAVFRGLREAFCQSRGRILVTLFSSNIQRIQEVLDCALETGRKVVVGGRSLHNNMEMAARLKHLNIPPGLCVELDDLPADLPEDRVAMLLTGSQGEPMSVLARIVWGEHKQLRIHPGDTLIMSSRLIPGNATTVNRMINEFYRQGAEVLYSQVSGIHASGHAYKDELAAMLEAVRPEYFIPIHGEYRHLVKHAHLARSLGIAEDKVFVLGDGQPLSLGQEGARREEDIPAGTILVDGKGVGDVGEEGLRERQILGEEGMVIVLLILRRDTQEIIHGPEIVSRGFVFDQHYQHVLDEAAAMILEFAQEKFPLNLEKFQDRTRLALRRFFRRVMGRNPLVLPVVRMV